MRQIFLNSYNVPEARILNYQHLLSLTDANIYTSTFMPMLPHIIITPIL